MSLFTLRGVVRVRTANDVSRSTAREILSGSTTDQLCCLINPFEKCLFCRRTSCKECRWKDNPVCWTAKPTMDNKHMVGLHREHRLVSQEWPDLPASALAGT